MTIAPPVYGPNGMLPDATRIAEAPYIRRNPATAEISWPPPMIEMELSSLGLIPRPAQSNKQEELTC